MAVKKSSIERRADQVESEDMVTRHQPSQQSKSLRIKLDHLKTLQALTPNQEAFFKIYREGGYLIGLFGSPGTGKTYVSVYRAIEEVLARDNSFKQLVVVRSAVQVRDQGFVPGTLDEKMEIYELPYREVCASLFGRPDAWERLKEQGHARFISTTAIRGITIDDAIIIVDECQSMTWHELSSVISRIGYRSKIIFLGDLKQNDLIKSRNDTSGLAQFLTVLNGMKEYQSVEFTPDDIVRSSLVKSFILACDKLGY